MIGKATNSSDANTRLYNLVTFRLSQQVYALPIECVVQIIPMVTITEIPRGLSETGPSKRLGDALLGVINVRGSAVPVLDLRLHLGLSRGKMQLYTPIILGRINGRTVGMVVDEVLDVVHLAAYEVVDLEDIFPDGVSEHTYLLGMARIAERLVPLLDADHLFEEVIISYPVDLLAHNTGEAGKPAQAGAVELPEGMVAGGMENVNGVSKGEALAGAEEGSPE